MSLIIVTGVNGFVGQHITKNLHESGHEVIGIGRENPFNSALIGLINDYLVCDLTDESAVRTLKPYLKNVSAVINLAGIATTNNDPAIDQEVLRVNTAVHEMLYAAMHDVGSKARVLAVTTGLAYEPNQAMPLFESSKLQDDTDNTSAYVRSKLRVEQIAEMYRELGMDIITVRPFNHTGKGQMPGFFIPDQIIKIRDAITTGERMQLDGAFDFWRDFTHVDDMVEAYRLLATLPADQLSADVYNVASGVSIFGRDLFRLIASKMNFKNYALSENIESSSHKIQGSHDLLTNDTGWAIKHTLEQAITDQL